MPNSGSTARSAMDQFMDQFHFREFLAEPALNLEEGIKKAAQLILDANNVVAFTGAGISVESGIPDFRSPNGLWAKFDPIKYCSYDLFLTQPELFWEMASEMERMMAGARPNPAHLALVELQALGKLAAIITQNVDHLHQGSRRRGVLWCTRSTAAPAPGPARRASIARTAGRGRRHSWRRICDGVMKMDVVLFGEELPQEVMEGAKRSAATADVMLVVGTSLMVAPANRLTELCRLHGGKIVMVNINSDSLAAADVGLEGKAGEVLPRLVAECKRLATARAGSQAQGGCSAL